MAFSVIFPLTFLAYMLIFPREGEKRMGRWEQDHDGMLKEFGGRTGPDRGGGSLNGGGIPRPAFNPYILYPLSMLYDFIVASMLDSARFDHFDRNEPK
jgi:hypothetical protein